MTAAFLLAPTLPAEAGVRADSGTAVLGWQAFTNPPPFNPGAMFLMTDGTLMVQTLVAGAGSPGWWRLTPDSSGSYVDGTWSQVASLPADYGPGAYAAAVLPDGRLAIDGGEFNNGTAALSNKGAVYNPLTNTWTMIQPPNGGTGAWAFIGDSPGEVLADGRWMVGDADSISTDDAILDPTKLTWTTTGGTGKLVPNTEAGFTLLPDGKVLSVDVFESCITPRAESFDPATAAWSDAGTPPAPLTVCGQYAEIGPQLMLDNGKVFVEGATKATALYDATTGTWSAGPNFPLVDGNQQDGSDDGAALLPDGHVLLASRTGDVSVNGGMPSHFFLFDGTSFTRAPDYPTSTMGGLRAGALQRLARRSADLHGPGLTESGLGADAHRPTDPPRRGHHLPARRAPAQRALRRRRLRRRLPVEHRLSPGADHQRRHRSGRLRAHVGHDQPLDRARSAVLHELHAPELDRHRALRAARDRERDRLLGLPGHRGRGRQQHAPVPQLHAVAHEGGGRFGDGELAGGDRLRRDVLARLSERDDRHPDGGVGLGLAVRWLVRRRLQRHRRLRHHGRQRHVDHSHVRHRRDARALQEGRRRGNRDQLTCGDRLWSRMCPRVRPGKLRHPDRDPRRGLLVRRLDRRLHRQRELPSHDDGRPLGRGVLRQGLRRAQAQGQEPEGGDARPQDPRLRGRENHARLLEHCAEGTRDRPGAEAPQAAQARCQGQADGQQGAGSTSPL